MSNKGWISLHRKITDHWVWESDKPFDKRAAWIDILLMVNHKKRKVNLGNKLIEVGPGERITSERKLSERWGWSRTKVRNFLNLLEQDEMIEIKKDTKKTTLKVLNYSKYQGIKNQSETTEKDKKSNKLKKSAKKDTSKKTAINSYDKSDYSNSEYQQKNHKKTKKKPQKNHAETQTIMNNNENNDNKNNNNNVQPKFEIKKIYNSLDNYWKTLFKDYIDVYRFSNKTNKITTNRHLKLLKELKGIFDNMKFKFDGQKYNLSENIFEEGINTIIEREIDSLNYAKKIWISNIEEEQNEFSKAGRKEKGENRERKQSKYDQDFIYG